MFQNHNKDNTQVDELLEQNKLFHIHHILVGTRLNHCSFLILSSISCFRSSVALIHSVISSFFLPQPIHMFTLFNTHICLQGDFMLEVDFTSTTCACGCSQCVYISIFLFSYIFEPINLGKIILYLIPFM